MPPTYPLSESHPTCHLLLRLQTPNQRKIAYSCQPCNFTLHQSCATLPKLITHPSHPCTLTLLALSAYPEGIFNCDACYNTGNGWSYHCTQGCSYDLHVTCASKPLKIRHQSHINCHLDLTFNNPYPGTSGFSCDICKKIGERQWLYRCHTCGFDIHLDCTTVTITTIPHQPYQQHQQQTTLQHHHSFPAVAVGNPVDPHQPYQQHQQQTTLQHHHSFPAAAVGNPVYQQNSLPQLVHSASHPGGQFVNQNAAGRPAYGSPNVTMQQNNNNNNLGSNLMSSAMQGLVEGAFQTVGQTVTQDILASGGGGGGEGGGDDGSGGAYDESA